MKTSRWIWPLLLPLTACGGSSDDPVSGPASPTAISSTPAAEESPPSQEPPIPEASDAPPPTMSGNARRNPACKLLTVDEVAAAARLDVIGLLGLPADRTNPDKHGESCTWFLDPKVVQSSLVVQYTVYAHRPADLVAYYPQVVEAGFGRTVPHLGAVSKIDGHVLDTIFRRAEIHVTLLTHAEATPADQRATIALMRRVMVGIRQ